MSDNNSISKGRKFINVFMPIFGSVTLAAGAAGVVLTTTKACSNSHALNSAHEIKLKQVAGWNIVCNKKTAKKGDKVKFDVTKATNATVNKVPDYLSTGSNKFSLTKDENLVDFWTTGEIVWDFVEDKTVELTLKEEIVSDVLWDIGFILNGGSTTDETKLYQKIQDNCLVTNMPYIAAPNDKTVFDKWEISIDFGETWSDFDNTKDVITSSAIIKPIWKYSDDIIHTATFFCNVEQGEQWISGKTTGVEIKNNTLWKDVEKPIIEKTSYELDGWYYIDSSGNTQKLTDDTKIAFEKGLVFTIFCFWKEAKGTISFTLKDDKLRYASTPAEFYKIETGTKLSEIARPTILGSKDEEKVDYPNGTWLLKKADDTWEPVDERTTFDANTNITIAPDWSEVPIGQNVTTNIIFDAGEGDFGDGLKYKNYSYTQTITTETTEMGCKWSDVKSFAPTTINAPAGWQLDENNKWGIELNDDTFLFGTVTLKANYIPTEKHTYIAQLTSDDQEVSWSGTQLYTKDFVGKIEDEKTLTIGDLGFIKKEVNEYGDATYSLDGVVVRAKKIESVLNGWQYYKNSTWVSFSDDSELSNVYSAMYSTKLSDIADSDGNIKIRPTFTPEGQVINLFIISSNPNIYLSEGSHIITMTKKEASAKTFKQIMEEKCTAVWRDGTWSWMYVPISYTDLITEKRVTSETHFTDTTAISINWGLSSFTKNVSLVNCEWMLNIPEEVTGDIKVGTVIPQFPWNHRSEYNSISLLCDKYYNGEYTSLDELAQAFGYEKADDLIGLERTVEINGHDHKVRVIGVGHDELADGSGKKAALTFEMVDLLSDIDGKQMLSYYDKTYGNVDYTNSELRKNLTGNGSAEAKFYKKDGTDPTSSFTTAYDMLPTTEYEHEPEHDLKRIVKTVKKHVATKASGADEYTVTEYEDKLFPLTMTEMGQVHESTSQWLEEGTPYQYWVNNDTEISRRKKPILHEDTSAPGLYYSLASPVITNLYYGWAIDGYGSIFQTGCVDSPAHGANKTKLGVSFAFCI